MLEYFWIIPLAVLATSVITLIIGKHMGEKVAWLGVLGTATSLLLSLAVLPEVIQGAVKEIRFTWFLNIESGFVLDQLSALMLVVVSLLCTLIILYASAYMHGEKGQLRFFYFLQIFSFSMLGLVISDNLLQAFVFWELMGLCSYLLIGFWFAKPSAAAAAKKAFLTTRIGDVLMLIGILILYTRLDTFSYREIFQAVNSGLMAEPWLTMATLFIFGGVVGKSAQFPLHVWLPDAMEGPTPVSALIHAAAMVKAGIFLVARLYPIYQLVPLTLETMAVIGAVTAFGAALMAIVAKEFKQILAFSTLSQLGYMVVALGSLGYVAGLFHLVNHAFFKALLFLGAGSAIHGVGTNNVWEMGGLFKYQKITGFTMLLATLSIAGIPPFSGFWSKDEVLAAVHHHASPWIFWTLVITSFLTAFYMFRMYFLVFTGKPRSDYHAHESPWPMLAALVVLGFFAVFSGFAGNALSIFLTGKEIAHEGSFVVILSIIMASAGVLLSAMVYYWNKISPQKVAESLKPIYTMLGRRYYIDDLYNAFCRVVVVSLARFSDWTDRKVIDGVLHVSRDLVLLLSGVSRTLDLNVVDGAVNGVAAAADGLGSRARKLNTGRIQDYLVVVVLGLASLILLVMGGIL